MVRERPLREVPHWLRAKVLAIAALLPVSQEEAFDGCKDISAFGKLSSKRLPRKPLTGKLRGRVVDPSTTSSLIGDVRAYHIQWIDLQQDPSTIAAQRAQYRQERAGAGF